MFFQTFGFMEEFTTIVAHVRSGFGVKDLIAAITNIYQKICIVRINCNKNMKNNESGFLVFHT